MPSRKPTQRVKEPSVPESGANPANVRKPPPKRITAHVSDAPDGVDKRGRTFLIVGIGASAGGLEALVELFHSMPEDTGMAFVVITHQHPTHTSLLPELLAKATRMEVIQATDGLTVEPNHVYVSPPGGYLAILRGRLHRMETETKEAPHLPIDYFFRSLAEDQKERAVCIVLSGTGTDGTLGLKAIKGEAGMAMVQQVESAKYAGMPSSALATGLADYVLPAGQMPKPLMAYARGPYVARSHEEEESSAFAEPLQKIFVLLRSRTGSDFSSYKSSTIQRRIERRMNLHQIKGPTRYLHYLQENPHELDILFKELLISVTSFFRDPDAFESLARTVLPELVRSRPEEHTFRIWVPGCASGEEAFSLAILMHECLEAAGRHSNVQIFGTDLDNEAIETARSGRYPEGISRDVSPRRLERFFVRDESTFRVRKEVREMTIFAVQNVIKDPPFTKLDLISCRNLLIYLNADLQRRLLPIFHYALKPGGFLFLGSSETIGGLTDLFEIVDKKWKIFRRKETALAARTLMDFPARAVTDVEPRGPVVRPTREANIAGIVERLLLARFAPASVVVNERGEVVYVHGRTGSYLELAAGQPRHNVLDMAREGLHLELASALRQAAAQDAEVIRERVRVKTNGDFALVNLSVAKLHDPETVRGLLLVTFRPCPSPKESAKPKAGTRDGRPPSRIEELERELQRTKDSLQITIEELETSNEELKSANEELQSTNEELQSTNEEMETSKEEMQSLNEELTTVNTEMQSKVDDLSRINDDMQNLLNSTDVATLFLDRELNIKRYTEPTRRLINLIQTDVGRPLGDLVSSLDYGDLVRDCREVLRTLIAKVAELRTRDGHWYLMRIQPYRTAENVIDGVVLTFVDINPVKAAEKSLLRMSKVFLDGPEPMVILDLAGRIIDLNEEAVRTYGWSRVEMLGQLLQMIVPEAFTKMVADALQRCLSGQLARDVPCDIMTKRGDRSPALLTLKLLTDDQGKADAVFLLIKTPSA
jgi:two-component system CheB/CheR fusion protein